MSLEPNVGLQGRPYRRWIEGAALSLEANTTSTHTEDVYYVFQEGAICYASHNLAEAGEVFDRLRLRYWEDLLASRDPKRRLDGARGLVRHDRTHVRALQILAAEGDDRDLKCVTQARQRARYDARFARR